MNQMYGWVTTKNKLLTYGFKNLNTCNVLLNN
jgi:hypothetical protein